MKLLCVFISFFYLPLTKGAVVEDWQETEATYKMASQNLEFCCDREYTQESAHSFSEMESRKIVNRLLGVGIELSTPSPRPSRKGRRGQK